MARILIANRGEIACRVARTCHRLGHEVVAVYSDADAKARHVTAADVALPIGPAKPAESYLRGDKILAAASSSQADAIHPGYGFLAENAEFAKSVEQAGLKWIGPAPRSISDMGDKERARDLADAAGVPILPGSRRFAAGETSDLSAAAKHVGYPLLVKAAAGGGGIGMRLVEKPEDLSKVAEATQSLAERAFGDGTIFLERYVRRARHIEVQVFGLGDGRAVHLFERECSIQRRFQKIIEETPAPNLSAATIQNMCAAAIALTSNQRYAGAGTVEFILDAETGDFYFLEMNTRIQVEHPITEETTGHDLVALQLKLAFADDLSQLTQENITRSGHAIEFRLCAEDPRKMFLPSPGPLNTLAFPRDTAGLRIDTGVDQGDVITPFYDPMIAKIIVFGQTRDQALEVSTAAISATRVEGIATNLEFLGRCAEHPAFARGDIHTGFVEVHKAELLQ